jgi:cbb3-type cytochrome oxidase subunit 3
MKKIFLISFQILAILLLAFLALSTFMPIKSDPGFLFLNNFYNSPLNLVLWLLLAMIIIVAVVFKGIRSPRQKILHIALAVIIVLFIIDKSTNERFFVTIREGESIELADHIHDHEKTLRLDRFEIDLHDDEETPRSYRSYLRLNDEDAVLEVNKPLAVGKYRLYQSAFEKHYYFELWIGNEHVELTFGDTVTIAQEQIVLDDYNTTIRHFRLIIDGRTHWLPLNSPVTFDDIEWSISPVGEVYSSVIEVVKVSGLFWLLLAGIVYLLVIAWDFWKPKKRNKEEA